MNTKPENTLAEMLKAIEDYPYLRACFSDYLKWLFEKCDEDRRKYDPAYMRMSNLQHNLSDLENAFSEAGEILGMNKTEFCESFHLLESRGVKSTGDWNKNEILKIGDLLAEPWVAIALKNCGFRSIQKVAESSGKFADFVGEKNGRKIAVEVKNVRTDSDFHRRLVDNSGGRVTLEEEKDILIKALKQKFCSDQRKKFEKQLRNTAKKYGCQKIMLVLYLETTTLTLFPNETISELDDARKNYPYCDFWNRLVLRLRFILGYPVIDYLACCINRELFCSPQLS